MLVLVTGGSGFLGSHTVEALVNSGYKVINLDIVPPKQDQDALFILGDIRDNGSIDKALSLEPNAIIHLAAKSRTLDGVSDPISTYETNVMGSLKLLEFSRKIKNLRKFVFISSEQVYGNPKSIPIKENHTLRPDNIYAASKASAETLVRIYARHIPTIILRCGMMFGPRSPPNQVITKFFLATMSGKPIFFDPRVEKNPYLSPSRDCNFVLNTVDALLLAINATTRSGEVINIGSGQETSILQLAGKIVSLVNEGSIVFSKAYTERAGELGKRFCLDINKAKSVLGYEPKISLDCGLSLTFEWLKCNRGYLK